MDRTMKQETKKQTISLLKLIEKIAPRTHAPLESIEEALVEMGVYQETAQEYVDDYYLVEEEKRTVKDSDDTIQSIEVELDNITATLQNLADEREKVTALLPLLAQLNTNADALYLELTGTYLFRSKTDTMGRESITCQ